MKHYNIVYVALDPRRAVGIQKALGCRILTLYRSDFLDQLGEEESVFCLEKVDREAAKEVKSTSELLKVESVREFIGRDSKLIVFKPSHKIRKICDEQGWTLLAPPQEVCSTWEDKLTFFEKALEIGLSIPKGEVLIFGEGNYEDLSKELGHMLVVQTRRGQSGNSTFLVHNIEEWSSLDIGLEEKVKVSEFLEGDQLTANVCVNSKGEFALTSVWKQLTGDKRFTPFEMGTFGVTPFDLSENNQMALRSEIAKIVAAIAGKDYVGIMGVDMIMKDGRFFIVEVNPRLIATVAFEAVGHEERFSLAVHAGLSDDLPDEFSERERSMIIFRNTSSMDMMLTRIPKSGYYRFENGEWVFLTGDIRSYILADVTVLFLSRYSKSVVRRGMDFSHLEVSFDALDENSEVDDRIVDFFERMVLGRSVREKDFWVGRFAKSLVLCDILREPVSAGTGLSEAALRRLRQSQFEKNEVLRLLGESNGFYLVEKFDGTRGWLPLDAVTENGELSGFELQNSIGTVDAKAFLDAWAGTPYLWGGVTRSGVDCSGFTQRFFLDVMGVVIPKHSKDQRKLGEVVDFSGRGLRNGDLLFGYSKKRKKRVHHAGLFWNERVWHACLLNGLVTDEQPGSFCDRYAVESIKRIKI
jgi:predicted ATP-grasp superfamily ATP-dependent carboligase